VPVVTFEPAPNHAESHEKNTVYSFDRGEMVTMTLAHSLQYKPNSWIHADGFEEFEGSKKDGDWTYSLQMDVDAVVTPVFRAMRYIVLESTVGKGAVTLFRSPIEIDSIVGESGETEYHYWIPDPSTETDVMLDTSADDDWSFDYWDVEFDGGTEAPEYGKIPFPQENSDSPLTVDLEWNRRIRPHFYTIPGVTDLDLPADLEAFLATPAVARALPEAANSDMYDGNEISYDIDGDRIYGPNGIPDKAEFYFLQEVLDDKHLDMSPKDGVTYGIVSRAWLANRAQAAIDLAGQPSSTINTVAAYLTLGNYGSAELIEALLEDAGLVADFDPEKRDENGKHLYDNQPVIYFREKANADMDYQSNLQEWSTAAEAYPRDFSAALEAYVTANLDGTTKSAYR
jgi:hypothetical protein